MHYTPIVEHAEMLQETVAWISKRYPPGFRPEIAIVLGSGLNNFVREVKKLEVFSYKEIPGFATPRVQGHAGELILGKLGDKSVMVFCGRIHFYEGYSMQQATFQARTAGALGVQTLILTCAAGAVKRSLKPGDFAVVEDHVNFMGTNPLRGPHHELFGHQFPDMSRIYDPQLIRLAKTVAAQHRLRLTASTYWAVSGPSYETPAEIKMFAKLGADIVGMSMVPESIAAKQMGMKVLGLAYIANQAAGISQTALNHDEVLKNGQAAAKKLSALVKAILLRM